MYCFRKIKEDLFWIGVNDHRLDRFENIHPLPNGVSYNAYLLLDEKTVLFDAVDWAAGPQFIENLTAALGGRTLDYIVIHHAEPDHAATVGEILLRYPEAIVISSQKGLDFLRQFAFIGEGKTESVKEGDVRAFGKHSFTFFQAPMVHWPEVIVSFEAESGILFSADAFGTFGALDGRVFQDEVNFEKDFMDEARRYYSNIVGKYGVQVQNLLKKTEGLGITSICPLHGPVWRDSIGYYLEKYQKWSTYEPEEKGVLIIYGSMYGNTESAACHLASLLSESGMHNLAVYDVSDIHISYLISEIYKYSHIVLASVTYNLGIYPPMLNLLEDMKALNVQNRTVALIENGTWAIKSGTLMNEILSGMKNMRVLEKKMTVTSSMDEQSVTDLKEIASQILDSLAESEK